MVANEIAGIGFSNRPEHSGRKTRRVKKLTGKSSWFKKPKNPYTVSYSSSKTKKRWPKKNNPDKLSDIPPESVLFIPFTSKSGLKRSLQEVEARFNKLGFGKVGIVETIGNKLNQQLSNTAPWTQDPCGRQDCQPCKHKPGSCLKRNCTYKVSCNLCPYVYWGESHRTLYDRTSEHLKDLMDNDEKNALVKHRAIHHQGQDPQFIFQLHKVWKNSLSRQIGEAIAISEEDPNILMNSRSEWGSNPIPRVKPAPADQLSPPPGDSSNSLPLEANPSDFSAQAQSPNPLPRKKRRRDLTVLQPNHVQPSGGPMDSCLRRHQVLTLHGMQNVGDENDVQAERSSDKIID